LLVQAGGRAPPKRRDRRGRNPAKPRKPVNVTGGQRARESAYHPGSSGPPRRTARSRSR
jgi:hypothetical protein